jgi:hypothetical protein
MKRPVNSAPAESAIASLASAVSALADAHPTLWGFLTEEQWDDGAKRTTSTMTFFFEHGLCKICLNDRDAGKTCWQTGRTAEGALEALEMRLKDETADWRGSKPSGRRSR